MAEARNPMFECPGQSNPPDLISRRSVKPLTRAVAMDRIVVKSSCERSSVLPSRSFRILWRAAWSLLNHIGSHKRSRWAYQLTTKTSNLRSSPLDLLAIVVESLQNRAEFDDQAGDGEWIRHWLRIVALRVILRLAEYHPAWQQISSYRNFIPNGCMETREFRSTFA